MVILTVLGNINGDVTVLGNNGDITGVGNIFGNVTVQSNTNGDVTILDIHGDVYHFYVTPVVTVLSKSPM